MPILLKTEEVPLPTRTNCHCCIYTPAKTAYTVKYKTSEDDYVRTFVWPVCSKECMTMWLFKIGFA